MMQRRPGAARTIASAAGVDDEDDMDTVDGDEDAEYEAFGGCGEG